MASSSFRPLSTNDSDVRLARLLSQHDDSLCRGFITRLDHSPISAKRIAFFKAFVLNTFILIVISALAVTMISQFLITPPSTPLKTIKWITHDFLIISASIVLLRSTVMPFFVGECHVRIVYGFRSSEIVIRKAPFLGKQGSRHTVARAISPALLYSNASAMLSSEYWTLEYTAILNALDRISKGEFPEDVLEFSVWKRREQTWNVWELWKMHDFVTDEQEVEMFKSLLIDSGKGKLLAVWQGIMSDDKALDKSSNVRSYQTVVEKFAREGLDYEIVWSQVSEKRRKFSMRSCPGTEVALCAAI